MLLEGDPSMLCSWSMPPLPRQPFLKEVGVIPPEGEVIFSAPASAARAMNAASASSRAAGRVGPVVGRIIVVLLVVRRPGAVAPRWFQFAGFGMAAHRQNCLFL